MRPVRRLLVPLIGLAAAALPAVAQSAEPAWSVTGYLQQSWPKQTETNRQIRQDLNGGLGTHFKTWDDVPNLNLGFLALRRVAPGWKVGLELDYSKGKIDGKEGLDLSGLGLGPGTASFEQQYSIYADLMVLVEHHPLGGSGCWSPFLRGGLGFAYEKDTTHLGFSSRVGAGDFELLKVNNSGWFPMATAGIGLDVYLSPRRDWFAEVGLSYSWARLKRDAQASGLLAPGATVKADTDSTGPNAWIGFGRRF